MPNVIIPQDISILLDAGHFGKYNQSPVVPEYYESDFAWKFHLMLKSELEEYGFKVDTTRDNKDIDLDVYKRGQLAKKYALFLSLHSNAFEDPDVDYALVFGAYDNRNNADVLGKVLAEVVSDCMGVGGHYTTRKSEKGEWEYYAVLRGASNSGCPLYYIIEHGFHTNPEDTLWLMSDDNLKRLAELEAAAIANYYCVEKPFELGDVNGDGNINAFDYVIAKRICFSAYEPTKEEIKRCDIDGDGKVTVSDYLLIKRRLFGTLSDLEQSSDEKVQITLKRLSKGSEGPQVKNLQLLLIGKGYACGNAGADGVFGSDTEKAVILFQTDKGISNKGIVEAETWNKLFDA